jgi:hypothetical protein
MLLLLCAVAAVAQAPPTNDPPFYGPYNGEFRLDGDGLKKSLGKDDSVLKADSPWTLYLWALPSEALKSSAVLAGVGAAGEGYPRYLTAAASQLTLFMGKDNSLSAPFALTPGKWHMLAATFGDNQFRLYGDGEELAKGQLTLGSVSPLLVMAPPLDAGSAGQHFGGKIAGLTLLRNALSADEIKRLAANPPDFSTIVFEEGSKPWYIQTRGQAGYRAPQDPATMPRTRAAFSKPVAQPLSPSRPSLQEDANNKNEWTLAAGWTLTPAPKVNATGADISKPNFAAKDWWPATVPGTVLTTMIDRGIYPDPDYGLNNLAIPESLNQQDYWYRNEFKAPKTSPGQRLTLTFEGINYQASVWLNGQSLGNIKGAFIRGVFDVTSILKPGASNVLAVKVSPPPHPGIPHEQSLKGGPGENGGIMVLDGPTFMATEGWDWIPAIRDRDTGIWQAVTLTASGAVKIGDPQVVTKLPLPDTSSARVTVVVPLENSSSAPVKGTLNVSFDQTAVSKDVTAVPGKSVVTLTPAEFPQLEVKNPRLWWPNGYGKPELYQLKLAFSEGGKETNVKTTRFGIRELTYELTLFDSTGHLRRVEYAPTARANNTDRVVDVSHEGIREIPAADPPPPDFPAEWRDSWKSWVASLAPGGESSPAIRMLDDNRSAPYLTIKVNGVRIAARGGSWGMDDSRKRVSRARLEPYFRLHRDANVNIIRNWMGQSTEETFFELADEYGLMVWNDFWATTQNYNLEPEDPQLFLQNARDTVLRSRNHPSIVVWCGRNEGVPQPILNLGLISLLDELDGTRYYSPSSNQINLQNSGPYKFTDATLYYTALNHGFSVETGTPSLSTLESFKTWIPSADQWPISDNWAYHDWHQAGNGDVAPLMASVQAAFGAPTSLEDFERKVQMFNYTEHRAIFEGMNAHLWAPNSGRMLWMTQPAWPSNNWQIISSDYDTQASYYGVKKACEKLHVQLDLSNYNVDVINNTVGPLAGLNVIANVYGLDNKLLLHHEERKDAAANATTNAFKLDLAPLMASGVVLLKLELHDNAGKLLSDNFYWLAGEAPQLRQLNRLPAANLAASATWRRDGDSVRIHAVVQNKGAAAAIENKFTVLNASGGRILPAYLSDNYFSLLPGETKEVDIDYPASAGTGAPQLGLRAWNLPQTTIAVTEQK